jgi:sugar lactone lactonase YvrE
MDTVSAETHAASVFAPGDLFICATDVEEATLDFRKGISGKGRILHCDSAFHVKTEIWTGDEGLIVGLAFDPIGRALYITNPQAYTVKRLDADGTLLDRGAAFLPHRRFGNLVFRKDGTALIGVHSFHGAAVEDAYGDGKLVSFDPRRETFEFHTVEIDGGRGGKHCISNITIAPDDRTVFYASEAGRRLSRYDVVAKKQLPPFLELASDDPRGTYGVQVRANGEVVMAAGIGLCRFAPDGALIQTYPVAEKKGWTRVKLALDGVHLFVGNFLDGILEKRVIETGELVASFNIERKGALTSVVEIPG